MLTRNSVSETPQPTSLRRSARLLNKKTLIKPIDLDTPKSKSKETPARSTVEVSRKLITSSYGSSNCENLKSRLRRSPRLSSASSALSKRCVNSTAGLRKSSRLNNGSLSNEPEDTEIFETKKDESRKKKSVKRGLLDEEKKETSVGLKAVSVEGRESERNEDFSVRRKRKPLVEADGNVQGWSREQESILQKAYFSAKPTPNFWKKVSKLVPGKSAQDCFDKIHSDHLTPIQPQPRSRSKRKNLSPVEHLSFSASKLLKSVSSANKGSRSTKHKSHLVQKITVRHLLQKQCYVDHGDDTDLFPILEPNTTASMHALPNATFSSPEKLLVKQGFLRKCPEKSSSGTKKHRSKLGNSSTGALISPPVLKQIKNRALHEKYIDQLHCREAKRKAESARAGKQVLGKENRGSQLHGIDKALATMKVIFSFNKFFFDVSVSAITSMLIRAVDL
ncbi:hypothetical protein ERO13_A02G146400v2 [Gossypium hirsutum]|nr:hypothetical protein ERO13_A02G146400v2 [Gossypium hirsutum]